MKNAEEIDIEALARSYLGILDQDGWETVELTIRQEHSPVVASQIVGELKRLSATQADNICSAHGYDDCPACNPSV